MVGCELNLYGQSQNISLITTYHNTLSTLSLPTQQQHLLADLAERFRQDDTQCPLVLCAHRRRSEARPSRPLRARPQRQGRSHVQDHRRYRRVHHVQVRDQGLLQHMQHLRRCRRDGLRYLHEPHRSETELLLQVPGRHVLQ